ncbi:MAG: universal stress protein [Thermodesulfobacteriota bacterium]
MKGCRKALIAVNGSMDVLERGLKLMDDEKCWVTVVKVIPPYEGDLSLVGVRNIEDVIEGGASSAISAINGVARTERALVKTRLEAGEVDKKIVEVAKEENCDIIIMGSKNSTKMKWLKKIFSRKIVQKVITHAPCPVLVLGAS